MTTEDLNLVPPEEVKEKKAEKVVEAPVAKLLTQIFDSKLLSSILHGNPMTKRPRSRKQIKGKGK